ncbi:hypothetical protein NDU88_006664 [Pleurodeles waltl]|uniref:Uncharacterized protein n=1 Tax=Pleurodeles waltl TaxID=8319 RepID=A0AAV7SQI6_PLEWA|nr:hypothetical protein NDU88_006664 [Pleurodeles waltl]
MRRSGGFCVLQAQLPPALRSHSLRVYGGRGRERGKSLAPRDAAPPPPGSSNCLSNVIVGFRVNHKWATPSVAVERPALDRLPPGQDCLSLSRACREQLPPLRSEPHPGLCPLTFPALSREAAASPQHCGAIHRYQRAYSLGREALCAAVPGQKSVHPGRYEVRSRGLQVHGAASTMQAGTIPLSWLRHLSCQFFVCQLRYLGGCW